MPDDSALSRLDTDSARYEDPRQNPIAFLPTGPAGRVTYAGHHDYRDPRRFVHDDGSQYVRAEPDDFDSFDEVDSRSIVDPGAPD